MPKPDITSTFARGLRGWLVCVVLCTFTAGAQAQSAKELQIFESFLSIMQNYLTLVESTHDVNASDSKAAVLQMQKMKEILDDQNDVDGAVTFFKETLVTARNRTVRNTAYMLLVDILKDAGRFDEAEELMRDALAESIAALDK